ncbi:unnamed protein product [Callosobruchus maculatus]|uniref:Uncharacterized protein n=1 Tax=Callosobruchus maculatus TaxID=64391 RepID=A0A653CFZ5_CALMS|nr:unnamed protein product [Callosobruchus maculatus]
MNGRATKPQVWHVLELLWRLHDFAVTGALRDCFTPAIIRRSELALVMHSCFQRTLRCYWLSVLLFLLWTSMASERRLQTAGKGSMYEDFTR